MNGKRLSEPTRNTKIALFALSGNECAFPGCDAPIYEEDTILGEICHIHAQNPGGARYQEGLTDEQLHGIGNLVLMCRKHHKIIDDHEERYPADLLRKIKADHESRAATTSTQVLHRLTEALVPEMPDNWWEWPRAPRFELRLASSRPPVGPWRFEVGLEQVDGSDIGRPRYRYYLGEAEYEAKEPRFERSRKGKLDDILIEPRGVPLALEFSFWWSGAERFLLYHWEKESDFQERECTPTYVRR